MQLSKQLNLPYREGFIKNRYIGRTFIMPGQSIRRRSVRQKLNSIAMEFRNKNVLLVDDSVVRGNTSREIVQMARESGARKVFFASAAPPVRFPNVYGIDMPTREELIASGRTEPEIAREMGCDELIYQDLDALRRDAAIEIIGEGLGKFRLGAVQFEHPGLGLELGHDIVNHPRRQMRRLRPVLQAGETLRKIGVLRHRHRRAQQSGEHSNQAFSHQPFSI